MTYWHHSFDIEGTMHQPQDWAPVVWTKNRPTDANSAAQRGYSTQAIRRDDPARVAAAKIDREEIATLRRIPLSFGKAVQQARLSKKMTQKQLAAVVNEKPQIINKCESGKALHNPALTTKLRRVLGIKGKFA